MAFYPVLPSSTPTIYGIGTGAYGPGPYGSLNSSVSPLIEIVMDWQNDPTSATTTWSDIGNWVTSYSRQPVRTNELDQPGPASASVTLRNDDGRFTPDNTSSPYSGGLKPYRRIAIRANWNGTIYERFRGYITDWPQSWDQAGKNPTVTLGLADAMTPLETYDLQGQSFGSKLSGAAIGDVLTAAGVSSSLLDTGSSTIVASGALGTQSYALQRLKDIAASENGVIYADGAGVVNFHDRHRRITGGASITSQGTIGDGGGSEIPYSDPQPQYGDVWPIVQVTPAGGSVQQAIVSAGAASFFNRTLNWPTGGTYQVSSTAEALSAAQYLANRYSTPVTRINSVTLLGTSNPTLWPTILALDTSDKVVFKRRVPGGSTISLTEFVEGYADNVQIGNDWQINTPLSPADIQTYWVLGDAVYGLLGTTTRLGY